ncbi:synphilin-1 isoform X3 [Dromiciops gliroides]|uniref:synphilin-1 isoform X3 n=1 Tax=Dromiciops gliroides TaxID=33562 RepID=UPI001CC5743A|nr:synphilin-1 isoform X3 [Dromiciops gliroides]
MEAPEYLDLDEIDFSDEISYSVTSLKTIPELCRRCESQNEDRSVSNSSWNCGVSTLIANAQKPTGIADVYSKFRPVKRVSPLKHHPETLENNESDDQKNEKVEYQKGGAFDQPPATEELCPGDGEALKSKSLEPSVLLGELEHYDLDMDEILDVPYIKSSQQLASFTKTATEKRILGICSTVNGLSGKNSSTGNAESLTASMTPFCVLSPVKSSHLKKAQSLVLDQQKHSTDDSELSPPLVTCNSVHEPETQSKGFLNKAFTDPNMLKVENIMPSGSQLRTLHLQSSTTETKLDEQNSHGSWNSGSLEERSEDMKKIKSILNIVKEGQISLLNGQLECVRWMVSETEAIAELSCSKDFPSLIHYAGCYGQEKILLWLLQFMQEQGISLDEVDQDGNSAVHVTSQHGYLGCIQTLVEYGANVTMQNHAGEKPSQSAERHGHTMCSRYLVVVETCMSLASQVVKLTKQLKEQTMERVTLQNQLQQLLEAQRSEGKSILSSPSSPSSPASGKSQWKSGDADELCITKNKPNTQDGIQVLGSISASNRTKFRAKDEDSDKILRQLLGKEISENVCTQEKLSLEFQDAQASSRNTKKIPPEKREMKLARLRQLMQRSLSESDTDSNNSEDLKNTPVRRTDKPRPQPIVESVESAESLHLMIKKHTLASGRRFPFSMRASKSVDGHSPSPTSESSDLDVETQYPSSGSTPQGQSPGDITQSPPDSTTAQKVATSPKSALKSPSSKRRTSQNLKLRVTFEEPVVQVEQIELEPNGEKDKDRGKVLQRLPPNNETSDQLKRPFGTFRSIMETLSGNQNNNNNYQMVNQTKTSSSTLPFTSLGRKAAEAKGNSVSSASKGKNKAGTHSSSCTNLSSNLLLEEHLRNYAWHNDINQKIEKSQSKESVDEPELQELFL